MEFHVTFRQNKKIVSVPSVSSLFGEICRIFHLGQPLLLQEWNVEWNDWIDVDYLPLLKNKSKLRVLQDDVEYLTSTDASSSVNCDAVAASPASSLESLLKNSIKSSTPPVSDNSSLEGMNQSATSLLNLLAQPTGSNSSSVYCDSHSSAPQSWSRTFTLPPEESFPPELRNALYLRQVPLDKNALICLLDCLFQEMRRHTRYPTSIEYEQVASVLLNKYPWLCEGCPMSVALDRWKSRLMQKFRNCRKRGIGFTEAEVCARKRSSNTLASLLKSTSTPPTSSMQSAASSISAASVWPSLVQQLLNGGTPCSDASTVSGFTVAAAAAAASKCAMQDDVNSGLSLPLLADDTVCVKEEDCVLREDVLEEADSSVS